MLSLTIYTLDAPTYKELIRSSFKKVREQEKSYQEYDCYLILKNILLISDECFD